MPIRSRFIQAARDGIADITFSNLRTLLSSHEFSALAKDEKTKILLSTVDAFENDRRPKAIKFFIAHDRFETLGTDLQLKFIWGSFDSLNPEQQNETLGYVVSSNFVQNSLDAEEQSTLMEYLLCASAKANLDQAYKIIDAKNWDWTPDLKASIKQSYDFMNQETLEEKYEAELH